MPYFGIHGSIKGGVYNAVLEAAQLGCQTVQLFTKNANQWAGKTLTDADAQRFRAEIARTGLRFPTAHDSYLINLASPEPTLHHKSMTAFRIELDNAEKLGLSYLVTHPGAHVGSGVEAGLKRVVESLDQLFDDTPGYRVRVLLETTAGQGTVLGCRFEHLATLLHRSRHPHRLGVCLDTCHIFAAGYAISTPADYHATFDQFDRIIGLQHLCAFHVNDSQADFGCRVDRHAHIGQGKIGLEAFRLLVNDERFREHPMILETDKADEMDAVNLQTLRGLLR